VRALEKGLGSETYLLICRLTHLIVASSSSGSLFELETRDPTFEIKPSVFDDAGSRPSFIASREWMALRFFGFGKTRRKLTESLK
jgi:hypothetical protein